MDVSGIIGLVVVLSAAAGSLFVNGGRPAGLLNYPALLLIMGGTVGATMMAFSSRQMGSLPELLRGVLAHRESDPVEAVALLVRLSRLARKSGFLALESESKRLESRLMRQGIHLVVDGVAPEQIRQVLETEVVSHQERRKVGESILNTMGGFAPSFGVIGTVIGVITALSRSGDPAKIGLAIAGALTATLYGIVIANLVFLPASIKIRARSSEEALESEMVIEGILSLQAGDSPRLVETKMLAFLPPEIRRTTLTEVESRA